MKKSIALKALKSESDEESKLEDEDMAIILRKFRKFFKKSNERRKFRNFNNQKVKKELITFYECKKLGHIRLKRPCHKKLKKKVVVAT